MEGLLGLFPGILVGFLDVSLHLVHLLGELLLAVGDGLCGFADLGLDGLRRLVDAFLHRIGGFAYLLADLVSELPDFLFEFFRHGNKYLIV